MSECTAQEHADTVLAQLGECRNCFMPCGQCPATVRSFIHALLAEIERLTAERDKFKHQRDKANGVLGKALHRAVNLRYEAEDRAEAAEIERDEAWAAHQSLAADHYFARAEAAERERDEALQKLADYGTPDFGVSRSLQAAEAALAEALTTITSMGSMLAEREADLEAAREALQKIADSEGIGAWRGWISDSDEMQSIARAALARLSAGKEAT